MSCHCLLTAMISDEKSAINLIKDPLYVLSHFPLVVFKILFVFVFQQFMMCLGIDLFEFIPLIVFLASWIYRLTFFTEFRKFGPFFFQMFFLPLSVSPLLLDFHYTYVVMLADVTQVSEALGFCFFVFYSFLSGPHIGSSQQSYF